ncbi:TPA: restriction endonuclease subunit S [Streptococcus pyogenes]|uniref:restriction endonuclease subunit S n=1 Tax=Streptococcus pyogenes TaxID=1314 RepID=UPI002B3E9486|nr:restriction endonuclease subunit S [Streptococcus pyogenes]HEQ3642744.1 restriction endonuclease subunit S [Streptococcus pyogenes]HEQ3658952.1 restriction endonuclease subunit S [Streptococcus pyogenes]HEQ3665061.1 restriction endonuclease subunit S [Streptococcus pyogenes]HEQ3676736.1 restriction endonuclease subunit S [Streptococcus pyogenes]
MGNSIEAYLADSREKVTLGTVVDCFKGKAVSSKVVPGDVGLINLSDMGTLGIQYHQLRTFQMDRRQLLRYLLEDGDVLIASKGTLKKVCVFHKQNRDVVASSNITVLRPQKLLRGYYIKFFLDSPIGQALLDAADHGKDVINLSTKELLDIPIPVIPLVKQDYLINHYLRGLTDYHRKLNRAEQEWEYIQNEIQKGLG